MKCGKFITKSGLCTSFTERIEGRNKRTLTLEEGDGILNIKKEFSLDKDVERVVLRATALGIFCLYINGERVGTRDL
jgi:hypothetical protein